MAQLARRGLRAVEGALQSCICRSTLDVACLIYMLHAALSDVAAIAAEIGLVGTLLSVLRQYSDEPTTAATSNTRKSLFVRPAHICAGTGLAPADV